MMPAFVRKSLYSSFRQLVLKRLLSFGAVVAFCLLATGCAQPPPPPAEMPPPEVTVATPVEKEFSEYLEFTGRTEAVEDVDVRARVTGYLLKVNFQEGEAVKAGDVLFEIDPRPYEAALKSAEAKLASAEAAHKKTKADLGRNKELYESKAISQFDYDTSVALEQTAAADVASAKATIEQANLDLEFATVVAPVDGRVSRAMVTKGNLISPAQLDSTLTTVVSVKPIDVYFDIDERSMLRIQRKMRERDPALRPASVREAKWPVDVQLADEQDFPHRALLDFTDNRVDPETGTIRVRARLPNEDEFLAAGLFVRVRLPLGDPEKRLLVPERAIGTDQGQRYVLIVKEDKSTERRDVTLGVRYEGGLRVIDVGLSGGEKVVVEGIQRVRPPAAVEPKEIATSEEPKKSKDKPDDDDSSTEKAES